MLDSENENSFINHLGQCPELSAAQQHTHLNSKAAVK